MCIDNFVWAVFDAGTREYTNDHFVSRSQSSFLVVQPAWSSNRWGGLGISKHQYLSIDESLADRQQIGNVQTAVSI